MSFRTLLALLCLSTVVIAQVPLSSPPSPSLPESVVPECLPASNTEKPIAPRLAKQSRRKGIRLAASLSKIKHEVETPSRHVVAADVEPQPSIRQAKAFPRTASLGTHRPVPIPRPLPGTSSGLDSDLDDTRYERLNRELTRKQNELKEIKAEIDQLTLDIAAAEPAQISIAMVVYELENQFEPVIELLAPSLKSSDRSANSMVVMPADAEKMLATFTDAGLLRVLSKPKLMTMNGREAGIEVNNSEFSFAAKVTPRFQDSRWTIDTAWTIQQRGLTTDRSQSKMAAEEFAITSKFDDGKIATFRITNGAHTFVAVLRPHVVNTKEPAVTPVSYTPVLPIPAVPVLPQLPMPEPPVPGLDSHQPIRIIRNVDINLKKTSAVWQRTF